MKSHLWFKNGRYIYDLRMKPHLSNLFNMVCFTVPELIGSWYIDGNICSIHLIDYWHVTCLVLSYYLLRCWTTCWLVQWCNIRHQPSFTLYFVELVHQWTNLNLSTMYQASVPIEFEFQWNFAMLLFITYSADHNKILLRYTVVTCAKFHCDLLNTF